MQYFLIDKNTDKEIINNLSNYGKMFFTKEIPGLYEPVNTHPDIQIHFFNKFYAVCCPEAYEYYKNVLPESVNLICGKSKVGGGYPNDAAYNVASFGHNLVCSIKYVDKFILDYYTKIGYNIINVKQGYTKCNICPVSENAVITEDIGICSELLKNNIDVCLIQYGEISLKNFEYGFIGGATGFVKKDIIGFLGNIQLHSEFEKINK